MEVELLYVTHPACTRHLAATNHPEHPRRLEAVAAGVSASGNELHEVSAEAPARRQLEAVHDPGYLDRMAAFSATGGGLIDTDTWVDESTWEAAVAAAGAGPTALAWGAEVAFLAVRPPGHHARRAQAMGFCFINNVAVTAAALRATGRRVAIIDWDVHHGNGTQEMFADDAGTLYVSLHQSPFYPLTGFLEETGEKGTVLNLPLPAGTAGDLYRVAVAELIGPIVHQFSPDHLLISAGYDAHRADPLAGLALEADDYGVMSALLRAAAPGIPVLVFLEGGYDALALETSTTATIRGLFGKSSFAAAKGESPPSAWATLARARAIAGTHWKL